MTLAQDAATAGAPGPRTVALAAVVTSPDVQKNQSQGSSGATGPGTPVPKGLAPRGQPIEHAGRPLRLLLPLGVPPAAPHHPTKGLPVVSETSHVDEEFDGDDDTGAPIGDRVGAVPAWQQPPAGGGDDDSDDAMQGSMFDAPIARSSTWDTSAGPGHHTAAAASTGHDMIAAANPHVCVASTLACLRAPSRVRVWPQRTAPHVHGARPRRVEQ